MAADALLLALAKKPPPGASPGGPGGGAPPELRVAMKDLISAVKSGDAGAAADAFLACFRICESTPHDEGGEDTESEA